MLGICIYNKQIHIFSQRGLAYHRPYNLLSSGIELIVRTFMRRPQWTTVFANRRTMTHIHGWWTAAHGKRHEFPHHRPPMIATAHSARLRVCVHAFNPCSVQTTCLQSMPFDTIDLSSANLQAVSNYLQ